MRVYIPDSLAYPITVTKVLCFVGDSIEQNDRLFSYEYKSWVTEGKAGTLEDNEGTKVQRSFYSDFECEFEGTIQELFIKPGQVISRAMHIAEVEESCRHEVQFGGMCANCGKDMTLVESYNATTRNTERAKINTVHGNTNLLVSSAEATRADEEAKRRLLDSRKLILVVDLDQTIIHATVDPTVMEWQNDPENPNYEAVKDVRKFQLSENQKADWYYIKLRPGTEEFLKTISKYYELHIYTMGTRAYADNIANIIDPDRKLFANRVLSRDENGTVAHKNLKRLFPVDSKMVVIIDDRGDVWSWSPNLVKVNPFDFFVGIGDINSSFLPKRPGVDKDEKPSELERAQRKGATKPSDKAAPFADRPQVNGTTSTVDHMMSMAGDQSEESLKEKTQEQDEEIEKQLENRPLLQMQKKLEAEEEKAKTSPAVEAAAELLSEDGDKKDSELPKYRHNLLEDDDNELEFLRTHLIDVHTAFYDAYENNLPDIQGGRVAELRPGHGKKRPGDDLATLPDAAAVMPEMKQKVLKGVHIVFSGVVPLGVDIQTYDTAVWAKSFGATVSERISRKTTHVVASPERRTAKVKHAIRKGGRIAIVSTAWLFACFREWNRVDEDPYRIHNDNIYSNGEKEGLPEILREHAEILSSSEEDGILTEEENDSGTNTPGVLNGDTNGRTAKDPLELDTDLEELEIYKPSDASERDDSSPIDSEKQEDWGEINEELAEFLGSDLDDTSDSEAESTTSAKSSAGRRTPSSEKKRKRDALADGDEEESGGEGRESKLQKRKREAIARTSSLNTVQNIANSSKGSTPAAPDVTALEPESKEEQDEDDDGWGDGGAEDEFEAELEAEMERRSEGDPEEAQ
ncbi:hypothetical protein K431DRAFT_285210 [Polychaeton citri CBS 116435]|uniref:RNA polymerase II subunit A C-terminal domain phosphatase n=1 Tax=Polychaeton citri CBS 116435 TaxID=1314669 RepID=A0A9P4UPN4_9PEZI|nr:hypothetical protein K431DRAFT_285210 [Polychaeton citri CBS 116435]